MAIIPKFEAGFTGSTTSITATYPTASSAGLNALAVGDLILLTAISTSTASSGAVTTPTGFTAVNTTHPSWSNSGTQCGTIYQYYRLATSADLGGSIAVAFNSTSALDVLLKTFGGVKASAPISGYTIAAGGSTGTPSVQPGSLAPSEIGDIPVIVSTNSNLAGIDMLDVPAQFRISIASMQEWQIPWALVGCPVATTSAINPTVTWTGPSSQMAICVLLTFLRPEQASYVSNSDVTAITAGILAGIIESTGSINVQETLQILLAAAAGVSSGQSTTSPIFKDPSGTHTRITGTLDGSNNRTAVTLAFS